MRRIIAFIKPNMLDDVIFALHGLQDFPGASISEVQDIGRGNHAEHRGAKPLRGFRKAVRMEIVCPVSQAEKIVETIQRKAHTGLPDDGEIFVSTVNSAVRLRTGEREDDTE
jgi:nitrogen regulatory protein P-II 1